MEVQTIRFNSVDGKGNCELNSHKAIIGGVYEV